MVPRLSCEALIGETKITKLDFAEDAAILLES